jgi:hypothetical protein
MAPDGSLVLKGVRNAWKKTSQSSLKPHQESS